MAKLPHLGVVLVDGKGHPLYAFVPDKPGAVCTRTTWIPNVWAGYRPRVVQGPYSTKPLW
jgi:hypothetical protein